MTQCRPICPPAAKYTSKPSPPQAASVSTARIVRSGYCSCNSLHNKLMVSKQEESAVEKAKYKTSLPSLRRVSKVLRVSAKLGREVVCAQQFQCV